MIGEKNSGGAADATVDIAAGDARRLGIQSEPVPDSAELAVLKRPIIHGVRTHKKSNRNKVFKLLTSHYNRRVEWYTKDQ